MLVSRQRRLLPEVGYDWNFSVFLPYAAAFGRGILVSISLTLISSICGTALGVGVAIFLRLRGIGPVLALVNDVFRAIPLLVLLFVFYYFPSKQILGLPAISPFWAAAAALTVAQTNFTAEVVRTAIDAVPRGLVAGARALGLKEIAVVTHIIAPHVLRQTLPTLIAFYIGNLKLSSLASIIGTEDVVYVAQLAVSQTYRSLEAWVVVALIYIILVVPCTLIARRVEQSKWMLRR